MSPVSAKILAALKKYSNVVARIVLRHDGIYCTNNRGAFLASVKGSFTKDDAVLIGRDVFNSGICRRVSVSIER